MALNSTRGLRMVEKNYNGPTTDEHSFAFQQPYFAFDYVSLAAAQHLTRSATNFPVAP